MKHVGVLGLTIALAAILVPDVAAYSRGAPPRTTGGPFPGERDCTRCHVGEVNSGPGTLSLTIDGAPASGEPGASALAYTPGETIALIVSFEDKTKFRVGFQLTARSGDGCGQPGSLAAASSDDGNGIATGSGTCGSAGSQVQVQWVTHQSPRNGSAAKFAIDWTAPAEAVGPVTIAVAVNGADGSQNVRDDNIYTLQAVLQPGAAMPAAPVISDGGVTSLGDSDSPLMTGAPGGIAVISGTGFADMGSESAGSVDADGKLATKVGGICVEVNQVRAPVLNVDSTTAYIQIPPETAAGSAAVQVIRNCDPGPEEPEATRSNTAMFQVASVQPVLLQVSETMPGVAAVHSDFSLVAEPPTPADTTSEMPAMSDMQPATVTETADEPGPMMSLAVPGEVVTFFGTGMGATHPALASGEIPSLPNVLAAESVQLMFGETVVPDDHIVYAGATPGVAGLYQLSAKVPDAMAAGEFTVSLMVEMQSSPSGPKIAIGAPDVPAADEVPVCTTDMVLNVGESCSGSLLGYTGVLQVEESQACVVVMGATLGPFCGEENLDLIGQFVAEKQSDNTWKVTKVP